MATSRSVRIGVDVGGTNTDAVVLDPRASHSPNRGVIAFHKTPTTSPNITDGIETAVRTVLEDSNIPNDEIGCLIVGTTHFINAIIEHDARRLSKVAVIRLSKSFTRDNPPFSDFPPTLKHIMNGYYGFIDGGLHIDGSQEAPIVEDQIIRECEAIKERGIESIVVCGVFSPIDNHFQQEKRVREVILRQLPGKDCIISSEVSNIGLMERENASILNASILKFARRTVRGFGDAMKRLNLHCSLYITQNDGTLISASEAARLPIRTFSSGPTNSMRGATYLGLSESEKGNRTATIVVDIGGTTTDVGVLLPSGFPRQASAYVTVAGVKVNFSMPHIESIGLGGGSIVREGKDLTVGPDSVGHYLETKARVFGGNVLTATDIAVAGGEHIGDPRFVQDLSPSIVTATQARIKSMMDAVIDQMKTAPDPLPVILVGGGSVICPNNLDGVSKTIRPPFHSVANAVGAAITKVGGSVDLIQNTADKSVASIVEHAREMATERAVAAGAERNTVVLAEVDAIPVSYVANQIRVLARAVGELRQDGLPSHGLSLQEDEGEEGDLTEETLKEQFCLPEDEKATLDIGTYRPKVVNNSQTGIAEWLVSEIDAAWLADGCYVLGCAGGGSPFPEWVKIRDELRAGHTMRIIDSSSLAEDAIIYWGGHMGSPAVSVERLAANETLEAVQDLMEYLGHRSFDAVMGLEIGGANGLQPLLVGSSRAYDRPVVDADWMGRAYPTYWQTTLCVHDPGQLVPCAIASGDGKSIIMTKSSNDEIVDRALRAACAEMGSRVGKAAKPTTKDRLVKFSVLNTLSLAWRIGRCIARAQANSTSGTVAEQIIDEVGGPETAKVLFRGKIVAVERRLFKGHSYGEISIKQTRVDEQENDSLKNSVAVGGVLKIPFKNENIYAKHVAENGSEKYIATVPDLISVLDSQSGKALGVPEYRYGVTVTVLGIACSPRWSDTPKGIEIGGPAAFGYDIPYKPLGVYVEPKSVVLEYAEKIKGDG